MRLVADVGQGSLAKNGEELCGDRVEVVRQPYETTVVLSDGLGSGVKANILATLTTKIAAGLLARSVPLEEVISTIAQTLPVCRERHIAYSTLAVVQVRANGATHVMLLDSPPVFLVRQGQVINFPTRAREVAGRTVEEGTLELVAGDLLVMVSDGVLHAGIGGLLPLGLGEEGLARHLTELVPRYNDAKQLAGRLIELCSAYYTLAPGDDSTVVVLALRRPRRLVLFTGPPRSPAADAETVDRFMKAPGKKVVCGGTTAKIVA
ncbi:MAG TPA: SpoIIE family protein phosphatase, partial [Firmicutes bacterium]|nr:SpoIIE family protein phosphatase [Bacillota bacterium]